MQQSVTTWNPPRILRIKDENARVKDDSSMQYIKGKLKFAGQKTISIYSSSEEMPQSEEDEVMFKKKMQNKSIGARRSLRTENRKSLSELMTTQGKDGVNWDTLNWYQRHLGIGGKPNCAVRHSLQENGTPETNNVYLWLQEQCNDVFCVTELASVRAYRLKQKIMTSDIINNPKNVNKLVESVRQLIFLTCENLKLTKDSLDFLHRRWLIEQAEKQEQEECERVNQGRVEQESQTDTVQSIADGQIDVSEEEPGHVTGGIVPGSLTGIEPRVDRSKLNVTEREDEGCSSKVSDTSDETERGGGNVIKQDQELIEKSVCTAAGVVPVLKSDSEDLENITPILTEDSRNTDDVGTVAVKRELKMEIDDANDEVLHSQIEHEHADIDDSATVIFYKDIKGEMQKSDCDMFSDASCNNGTKSHPYVKVEHESDTDKEKECRNNSNFLVGNDHESRQYNDCNCKCDDDLECEANNKIVCAKPLESSEAQYTAEAMRAKRDLLCSSSDDDYKNEAVMERRKRKGHMCKKQVRQRQSSHQVRAGTKSDDIWASDTSTTDSELLFHRQQRMKPRTFAEHPNEYSDEKLIVPCSVKLEQLPAAVLKKYIPVYNRSESDVDAEQTEMDKVKSLINLKNLKYGRRRLFEDSEDEKAVAGRRWFVFQRRWRKKVEDKEEETLMDFHNLSDSDRESELDSNDADVEDNANLFRKLQEDADTKRNRIAKHLLLQTSDSDTDFASDVEDTTTEKEVKKLEKVDTKPKNVNLHNEQDEEKIKRKSNWRCNALLRSKLSDTSSDEEVRKWKLKRERLEREEMEQEQEAQADTQKLRKVTQRLVTSSDSDDIMVLDSSDNKSDPLEAKPYKRKATSSNLSSSNCRSSDQEVRKKRKRQKPVSDSDSGSHSSEVICSQKTDTPNKGRKNIRRVMNDKRVGEATRRAAKEEEERRQRIAEKQKLHVAMYGEVDEDVQKMDKLVLDFDPGTKEELVQVDRQIVSKLKPHQIKGVKFMWDACFESIKQMEKTEGSGCILAHCMGLGKTLQVVALVHTLIGHSQTKVKTVLVVCPLSTVLNWVNEFNLWLKAIKQEKKINIYELTKFKQHYERKYHLQRWQETGGVMIIGYEMFRNLVNSSVKRIPQRTIDMFQTTLLDPGPDLVVCDEGHLLKNEDTALSKAMWKIRSLRRIVLTGTPLQNNLKEYHCMLQFVKPNLLGTRKEFLNRFVNPIMNGQFEDSTVHDVRVMKRRAHVLHKMLEGCVQRFDYSVLTPFLPPKQEYVIFVRLTELQVRLYQYYLQFCSHGKVGAKLKGTTLFADFQVLQKVWTHPRVLQMDVDKKCPSGSEAKAPFQYFLKKMKNAGDELSDVDVRSIHSSEDESKEGEKTVTKDNSKDTHALEWWRSLVKADEMESVRESGKLMLLFSILRDCEKIGDKVLVFSQSLFSLDLIEYYLCRIEKNTRNGKNLDVHAGSWVNGLDYFRLDGSTPGDKRNKWCKTFNHEDNRRARLFLISTRAGGLGINLYSANRVVIFDASWNPSYDVQSISRVYRFGQKKPCYIYRFLALGTMEEKIYDRQVAKLSLSCRVVDEQQIERHYNMAALNELYRFNSKQKTDRPTPILPKDHLLADLLKEHEQWIETYHEHDSLLENKEEEELNEEERKAAWEDYENEKKEQQTQGEGMLDATRQNYISPNVLHEMLRKQNPGMNDYQLQQQFRLVIQRLYSYSATGSTQQSQASQYQQELLQKREAAKAHYTYASLVEGTKGDGNATTTGMKKTVISYPSSSVIATKKRDALPNNQKVRASSDGLPLRLQNTYASSPSSKKVPRHTWPTKLQDNGTDQVAVNRDSTECEEHFVVDTIDLE